MVRTMLAAGALLSVAAGCDRPACTAEFKFGLKVSVMDSSTGAPTCDATVLVTDGAYQETLKPFPGNSTCVYAGAGERAGTYTIAARLDSKEKTVADVVVGHDECHVVPQGVTIDL